MVEEIIYTSAEKGLKQGSRGFCTVASTAGMALNVAERLESMSGYRHAFPASDERSALNPVNYSYVTMRLAGKKLHVLSRVADAGQDYTGRTNKLAHHIVVDNVASLTPGPARLLAESGIIVDRWDGVVRHIPPRELRAPSVPSSIQLSAWKAICGDGGWAGSVVEQLLQNPAPLSVIFNAGTDTLSLVREVLDLVPVPQRWSITFSTYFTRLLAGAECQLRFVLNDTPEATALRNDARARVVDLTKSMPAATGGALIEIARSGVLTPQDPPPPKRATPTPGKANQPTASQTVADVPSAAPETVAMPAIPRLERPSIGEVTAVPPQIAPPVTRSRYKLMLVVALVLCMIVTGALVATYMVSRGGGKPDRFSEILADAAPGAAQPSVEDPKKAEEAARAAEETQKAEEARIAEAKRTEDEEKKRKDDAAKAEEMRIAEAQRKTEEEAKKLAEMKALSEAEWAEKGPFVFIKDDAPGDVKRWRDDHGQWLFELPKPGEEIEPKPLPLRARDQNVELALCQGAKELFAGSPYDLELTLDTPDKWIATANPGPNASKLAEYTIERIESANDAERSPDCLIHFRWLPGSKRDAPTSELLRWWPLQIAVGDKSAVLLQKKAFSSDRMPTWKTLTDSNDLTFPQPDELKALTLNQTPHVSFSLLITQAGHEPQKLTLNIGADEDPDADESPSEGDEDRSADDPPGTTVRYFPITLPLKFVEAPPSVADSPLGFGTVKISLNYAADKGLIFRRKIFLTVRLPKKYILSTFPGPRMLDELNLLAKNPRLFMDLAPRLDQAFINATEDMTGLANAIRDDQINWHTQPLAKLDVRNSFDSNVFRNRADAAVKTVRRVIPELEIALRNAQRNQASFRAASQVATLEETTVLAKLQRTVDDAQTAFNNANKYAPDVQTFTTKMKQLTKEVDRQILELIKDYDAISEHIKAFEDEAQQGHFQVQSQLSGHVETRSSENPEGLTVYFVESLPEVGSR